MHLLDPMKRSGFKKVGDKWTLPLGVEVHSRLTGMDVGGSLKKLPDRRAPGEAQDWYEFATHNVPRLPEGHTHISVNHHERRRRDEVVLDRKRFAEAAGYEVDYARGF